ncbi:MAG TPA: N-acetyl-gamma-glutamyl-phosphate reductase [Verrucomicrobiae bacterium]|nr:N-acetyl-gamma-glutamyl-phosphate reductase [Verrucomicrobiae bacterium]
MGKVDIGIVGGTGYTGAELLRLLGQHPDATVRVLTSRQEAGKRADALFPQLRGVTDVVFTEPDVDALAKCQFVFFATPHGAAMALAPKLLERGVKVIDLSADFRLKDAGVFKQWYGMDHTEPRWLEQAVYGLPEMERDAISHAQLVACPGCYPTSVQLGLMPLLEHQLADTESLIADCKSGVSGAGRELKASSLFCEAAESLKAYGVSGHRHHPEIEQGLSRMTGRPTSITFVPHLVPMNRGIHATIYADLQRDSDVQALYRLRYRDEPFIDVLPAGSHPETRSVRGANHCRIAIHRPGGGRRVVILVVIDNLVKGAAGQAVQCFNLMAGLPEQSGLGPIALWP